MTRKREIMRVERTKEEEMMRRALRFVLPQATQNAQRKLSQRETRKKIDKTLLKQRGFLEVEVTLGINKIAHRA